MAIVKRHGKNGIRYQVRVKGSDGSWLGQTFSRKADAEDCEAKLKLQMKNGVFVSSATNNLTLSEYFSHWNIETAGVRVSAGWRKDQVRYFHKHVEPTIGNVRLRALNSAHVLRILRQMEEIGLSKQMQLHVFNLLNKMLKDAVDLFHFLPRNPIIKELRPRVPVKESKFLHLEDVKKLIRSAGGTPIEAAIYLQLYLGLRIGEAQALTWSNVFLNQGKILIAGTYVRKEKRFKDSPKGKKQYFLSLPIELLDYLINLQKRSKSLYVASSNGINFLSYQTYYRQLKVLCEKTGIPWVATHGLRHSTPGIYRPFGVSEEEFQKKLFFHEDKSTTDRYMHDEGDNFTAKVRQIRLFPENPVESFPKVSQT